MKGWRKFAGKVRGLPPDMALNHDHYLHGLPKKGDRTEAIVALECPPVDSAEAVQVTIAAKARIPR